MFSKLTQITTKVILACAGLLTGTQLLPAVANGQVIWSNASSSTLWLNGANWAGSSVPGSAQIGAFQAYPSSAVNGVGIDMGGSTNNGTGNQAVGAIVVDASRTSNFLLGNSSTAANGVLTLNGATVSGTTNVILANFGANASTFTIQNTQGSGNKVMGIYFGSTARNIATGTGSSSTAIGNTIKISSSTAGSGLLTFLGGGSWNGTTGNAGGLLKLAATNSFSGGINAGKSDGTSNGIIELDVTDAIANTTGNDISIYPNSELFLAATTGTFSANNLHLNLYGKGNNATLTSMGGALVTKSAVSYTWAGPVNLSSDATISVLSTGTLTVTGDITGSGALVKTGNGSTGTLVLSGTGNTWTGGTQVGTGVLYVNAGSQISTGAVAMTGLNPGLNTTLNLNNTTQTISSLSSSFVPATGNLTNNVILGSGHTLTLNQNTNTTYGCGAVTTQVSIITGSGSLVKTGTGILTLTSSGHTFTGGLTITGGEIRFNPATTTAVGLGSCPVVLNGGRLSTTATATTAQINLGSCKLTDNSIIDLGIATTHNVKFANSSALTWTSGKMLTVTNWMGNYNNTAGTQGRLFIGTNASGLTSWQLAQIQFIDAAGNVFQATQLSTGEVVAKAPIITTTAAAFGPYQNATANSFNVAFTTAGPFSGTFKAQLSNNAGVFSSDTTTNIIGTGSSSPIAVTIPAATTAGDNYKVRVINSAPILTYGSDNGSGIVLLTTPPTITSVTPLKGIPGAAVTINGTNFNSGTTSNIVYFGATRATVTSASATSLTVTAPTGATLSKVSVLSSSASLSAFSGQSFVPVYDTTSLTPGQINFSNHLDISAGLYPFIGVAGDLDGDGKSELISVNAGSSTISVYRNISTAGSLTGSSFASPLALSTGYGPSNAKIADIDGDGKPDIIVTNSMSNSVSVFRNLSSAGALSFASRVDFSTTSAAQMPLVVSVADFDGDGKPDMAVAATASNSIAVFRNTAIAGSISASSFSAPVIFATNQAPFSITSADFDGDHKIDIAVVDTGSATISVFRNTGTSGVMNSGSFAAKFDFATGSAPIDIIAGDVDGDGKVDLVASNSASNTISVLRNTASSGTIASGSFASKVDFATGTTPTGLALGDIDGDGKIDIATANIASNNVSVFRNTASSGSFTSGSLATAVQFAASYGPTGISIADLDGDGKPEIIAANQYGSSVSILRNFRLPNVAAITGTAALCAGNSATFHNATGGGVWSVSNTALATINTSGTLTALAAGTDTVAYSVTISGDVTTKYFVVNISSVPDTGTISGISSVCTGSTIALSETVSGGSWSSSNSSLASVNTSGVVTGITAGSVTITCQFTNFCGTSIATSDILIIAPPAAPAAITGLTTIAPTGASSTLASATSGGTWSSSNTAVATVNAGGTVRTITGGFTTITYTVANACGTAYATTLVRAITVNHAPYFVTGVSTTLVVCANSAPSSLGLKLRAKDVDTGQVLTWSLLLSPGHGSVIASASMLASGDIVTPAAVYYTPAAGFTGTDSFSVTVSDGINDDVLPFRVTVNPVPAVPVISGPSNICGGLYDTLTGTPAGGRFSDTSSVIAVSSGGVVRGSAAGTGYAIYVSPANTFGCTSTAMLSITVAMPMPSSAITGAASVCPGATTTLSNSFAGGTWTSSNAAIASVHDSIVSGVISGSATISYTLTNACGTRVATKPLTVTAATIPTAIAGSSAAICAGSSSLFTDTRAGGVWSVANTSLATISSTGLVTAISAGYDTVLYTITNSCGQSGVAQKVILLANVPNAGVVSGPASMVRGATATFTTSGTGGTWTSVFTAKATINSAGSVHTLGTGVDTIKYTVANTCGRSVALKVLNITASRMEDENGLAHDESADISVYPNPNNGTFILQLPAAFENAMVVIYDVSGRVINTRQVTELKTEFSFDNLAKGSYILTITTGDQKSVKQIIVD